MDRREQACTRVNSEEEGGQGDRKGTDLGALGPEPRAGRVSGRRMAATVRCFGGLPGLGEQQGGP